MSTPRISIGMLCLMTLLFAACRKESSTPPPPESSTASPSAKQAVSIPVPNLEGITPALLEEFAKRRSAVEQQRDSAGTWGAFGMLCDAHGLREEAQVCYREASRLDTTTFDWPYHLAVVQESLGQSSEECRSGFEAALQRREDYAPAWIRLAKVHTIAGQIDKARRAYQRALVLDPRALHARRGLGQTFLAESKFQEALEHLQLAASLDATDRATLSALAQAWLGLGQEDRAEEFARRAGNTANRPLVDPIRDQVQLLKENPTSIYMEAKAAFDAGNYEVAVLGLREVQALLPDDPYAPLFEAFSLLRLARLDEAVAAFEQALSRRDALLTSGQAFDVFNAALWEFRVESLGIASRSATKPMVDHLLQQFERGAAAEPAFMTPKAYSTWATTLCRRGQLDRCLELYLEAIRVDPTYVNGYFNIGVTYEAMGRMDEAIQYYRQASELGGHPGADARLQALGG